MKYLIIPSLFLLVACSGGSSDSAQELSAVELHFPDGSLMASGQVDALGEKEGAWTWNHENGQTRLRASFIDDQLASDQPWQLYNADGSTQGDSSDGSYVFEEFWKADASL